MYNKNSCKDCTKRVLGCHDNCESYKLYRENLDVINKKRKQNTDDKIMFKDYYSNSKYIKNAKHRNGGK